MPFVEYAEEVEIAFYRANETPVSRNGERIGDATPLRGRGGQPGNRNALRHGERSAAAILAGKLSVARVKALSYAVVALDMLRKKHRNRISPPRPDQIEMLRCRAPEKERAMSASSKSGGLEPTNSKTFCVLPFIHSYFATDGHASLCVISPDALLGGPEGGGLNVRRHSLKEIF